MENKEEKKIEPVVSSEVRTRKKTAGKRLLKDFFNEDIGSVGAYLINDVLVPAAKKTIVDLVENGISMLVFGDTSHRSTSKSRLNERTSYTRYYERESERSSRRREPVRARYDFEDAIFGMRGEAQDVLDGMIDILDKYDAVSIADMYELSGLRSDYTDRKYGWTNLSAAKVVHTHDGFLIDLPRPEVLD